MIISNAQISTKLLCDKAHHFRYTLKREPKKLAPALYRGVLGHSALEAYYTVLKNGGLTEEARLSAFNILDKEIARIIQTSPEDSQIILMVMKLRKLIEVYSEIYRKESFKVLAVEQDYKILVNQNIDYVLRLDLLVEMTAGEYRGDLVVVDHKFVHNFKSVSDIQMDAQLPKYIKVLKDNGYFVTKGMFNQIRTRDLKYPTSESVYKRSWIKPTKEEIDRIWYEQELVALQIQDNDSNPAYVPVRTMNYQVCRFCAFQGPCKAELDGTDISSYLIANYKETNSPLRKADVSDAA